MYVASAVSQMVGVPVESIIDWQQEFGIAPVAGPVRPGTRFTDDDVRVFAAMAHLVDMGSKPGVAIAEVRRRIRDGAGLFVPEVKLSPPTVKGLDPLALAIIEQASAHRVNGVRRSLRDAWAQYGPERVADDWAMAMLRAVGQAWECGDLSVAAEHLISAELRAALERDLDHALRQTGGGLAPVVVGTAPGVTHDMGSLALSALVAREGRRVRFMRAGLDAAAWERDMALARPAVIALAATVPPDVGRTESFIERLRGMVPEAHFFVGGRMEAQLVRVARPLGPRLDDAAKILAAPPGPRHPPGGAA